MSEMVRIADELDRMAHGGAWHGPAVAEALEGVSAEHAARRPIPQAHSIWEIVLHMSAWAGEVARRLTEDARPLVGAADWPQPPVADEPAWCQAKEDLVEAHRRLRLAIREFPVARLDDAVVGGTAPEDKTSFYVMLHGLAQHDAYHTGQIAILKKAMAAPTVAGSPSRQA